METMIFFGEWLKKRRKAVGLTQNQLALRLNCSLIHLRKIESSERRPSEQLVEQLAKLFNISEMEQPKFLRFARGGIQVLEGDFQGNDLYEIGIPSHIQIPASVTSIIGREQELTVLHQHLLNEKIRLITLIGPPGIGKTRLGLELARRSISDFPDGVFFVPLAPLENSSQIAPAIFQTLGYVESKNRFDIEHLTDGIGEKCILVLLDNVEHLIDDAAELVSRILSANPRLKIITTSRESLRISGEWLYTVPTLGFPKESESIDLENFHSFPALKLFVERAQAVDSKFSLNRENVQAVISICTKLDGVPLAIELIASRIRLYSPQILWKQLDEQFIMSADGMRAVSARQKTLRSAIQWSYNLLSGEEQELLAYLCVFNEFTITAANMLSNKGVWKSTADIILSLLDKSLIQRLPDVDSNDRFGMLMMIRQFALEYLSTSGREAEIRDVHLTYFLDLAEQAEKEIHGPNQLEWMEQIEREHANFRIALEWSVTSNKTRSALSLLGALGWTWWIRGHYSESREWFNRICNMPGVGDYPAQYAKLLNRMGCQSWEIAQDHNDLELFEESHALWASLGTAGETGLADCLNWMGVVIFDSGAAGRKKATGLIEQSLALYQKLEDTVGCAQAMLNTAYVNRFKDNTLEWYEKSLELFEKAGDVWGMCQVYQGIAREHMLRDDYEKARFYFQKQMDLAESLHYLSGLMAGMRDLGNLALYERDYSTAQKFFDQSLATNQAHGLKPDRHLLFFIGILALCQRDYQLALQTFLSIYQVKKELNDMSTVQDMLMGLSAVAAGMNEHDRAAKLYGAFQESAETTNFRYFDFYEKEFERHLKVAKDHLGEAEFERLEKEGRLMSIQQAVAYALEKR